METSYLRDSADDQELRGDNAAPTEVKDVVKQLAEKKRSERGAVTTDNIEQSTSVAELSNNPGSGNRQQKTRLAPAVVLGIGVAIAAMNSIFNTQISGLLSQSWPFAKYDLTSSKKIEPIIFENVPLAEDLTCDVTVFFTGMGKNHTGEYYAPSINVKVSSLPSNPDGTPDIINFKLFQKHKEVNNSAVFSLHTGISSEFPSPSDADIEYVRSRFGTMNATNSHDAAEALKKFQTPYILAYQKLSDVSKEECAMIARQIVELSFYQYDEEQRQKASALTQNAEGLHE